MIRYQEFQSRIKLVLFVLLTNFLTQYIHKLRKKNMKNKTRNTNRNYCLFCRHFWVLHGVRLCNCTNVQYRLRSSNYVPGWLLLLTHLPSSGFSTVVVDASGIWILLSAKHVPQNTIRATNQKVSVTGDFQFMATCLYCWGGVLSNFGGWVFDGDMPDWRICF